MNNITTLVGLFTEPWALILGLSAVFCVVAFRKNKWTFWILVGVLIFATSLSPFVNEWYPNPPEFIGPIQNLVSNGRSITYLLLVALVVYPISSRTGTFSAGALFLVFAHLMLVTKTLLGGSIQFAVFLLLLVVLVATFFYRVRSNWLHQSSGVDRCLISIATATSLFIIVNSAQFLFDPSVMSVAGDRFHGTTGNPQHAAVLLGVGVPALIYLALTRRKWLRLFAICNAIIGAYFLMSTGSRTGLLMCGVATFLLLRRTSAPAFIATTGVITVAVGYVFISSSADLAIEGAFARENTRTEVWSAMWRKFQSNLLFGAELSGSRLGFGESSWLAMGASTGVMGFIPLVIFGFIVLAVSLKLLTVSVRNQRTALQNDYIAGALISILLGSVFEAYLLSPISHATLLILLLIAAGDNRLIELRANEKSSALIRRGHNHGRYKVISR